MPSETSPTAHWIAASWASRLADAIETMAGERPRAECRAASGEAAAGESWLWWQQPFNLGPAAILWTGAPEPAWLAIGRHTLAAAGIESTETAEAKNTYLEVSSQAYSGLAQAATERAGSTVSCENGAEAAEPGEGAAVFDIEVALPKTEPLVLRLVVSKALADALEKGTAPQALELQKTTAPPHAERPSGALEQSRTKKGATLDLLMEVELPVSVSFGRAELPLKEVMKLTTGSIVELNRVLTEPVEVIVNNCVIARGEVVVVEGNYGVRIQEIISREKRLRTLR
ncbi:MAG: flagellar motor switch protein FliN [Acidobacteriota bacterium]